MKLLRIFFSKTGEAAYISHLDLQRVMARALRISGLPVWYSMGFNPHIYMTFGLPLPLLHQSLAEFVDVKTLAEQEDFSAYVAPLNKALPRGIDVSQIAPPKFAADEIVKAKYQLYFEDEPALKKAVDIFNQSENAMVCRKTKRTQQNIDLKTVLLSLDEPKNGTIEFCLPAGAQNHHSPALLLKFFQEHCGLLPEDANIVRLQIYTDLS